MRKKKEIDEPQAVKDEFARRLNSLMLDKFWSPTKLAEEANKKSPGLRLGRGNISIYLLAKNLPRPDQLKGLCLALECSRSDLVPENTVSMDSSVEGMVRLRVDIMVHWTKAAEIMALLNK